MKENLVEMRRVIKEAEQRVKQSNLKQVPLPTSSAATSNFENSSSSASAIDPKRRKVLDQLRKHSIWVHVK